MKIANCMHAPELASYISIQNTMNHAWILTSYHNTDTTASVSTCNENDNYIYTQYTAIYTRKVLLLAAGVNKQMYTIMAIPPAYMHGG